VLQRLAREAWDLRPEVVSGERGGSVHGSGEEAFAEGAERDEPDTELGAGGQHVVFRAAPPQVVLALDCGHRLHGVRTPDGAGGGLRHAEVLHLARRDQVIHRAGHLLDRHVRIDPVLVVQIDHVQPEPAQ
jgi:hypothetical protein